MSARRIDGSPRTTSQRWLVAAALWGFAEATLFFIVPDVLLSYVTLRRGAKAGFVAGIAATIGALLGGAIMFAWAARDPSAAEATLDGIPAISAGLIAATRTAMSESWIASLFTGAFQGTPYKIFAVEAGQIGIDPIAFLAASAPARYARFALIVLATTLGRWCLARLGWERWSLWVLSVVWLGFYGFYFAVMPN